MFIHLADHFSQLPPFEINRLQKQLRVILRDTSQKSGLGKSLRYAYQRFGAPLEYLEKTDGLTSFFRILDAFGILSVDQMSRDDVTSLLKNPYTIWPDERHCMVTAEAMELLLDDPTVTKMGYLFPAISRMGTKDLHAWMHWLGMMDRSSPEKDRTKLYSHLAWWRFGGGESKQACTALPEDSCLEDFFPDDPGQTHVAWYYRRVLPLHEAMRQAEKNIKAGTDAAICLEQIKLGKLLIVPENAGYGRPLRHRLRTTREGVVSRPPEFGFPFGDVKENLLF